jgi:hypothetical protein
VALYIAIAAVQHTQAADAGPRLQLASSRQRRRGAAVAAGELAVAVRGAARCCTGAQLLQAYLDSNTMSNNELWPGPSTQTMSSLIGYVNFLAH